MEPRIQYAKTKDGVSIAYWTLGEGTPFISMPSVPWSHIQLEWQTPVIRRSLQWGLDRRRLVRYDPRGCGSSDRDVTAISLESYILDLEAVADRLRLDRFVLFAQGHCGPIAIAYAARHPERVSHLILAWSYARASDVYQSPQGQAFRSLREGDWGIYTEAVAHILLGWSSGEEAHEYAQFLRECVTQDTALAAHHAIEAFDVADLLSHVRAPTLVLHHKRLGWPPVEFSRALASHVADARLAVVEGTPGITVFQDIESVGKAIDEFLGEGEEVAAGGEPPTVGTVHTILFTDVEGSTALTQRLGDAKARELLRAHEGMVREALKAHGGAEVKTMGDGFMASFSSATKALECAIAMQRAFAEHNESAEEPIRVRIGLNAGEPIAEDDDLFGTAVNRAARITAEAKGGEILVANVVRELAEGKDFLFADRGETSLKGIEDPVRLFQVRWQPDG